MTTLAASVRRSIWSAAPTLASETEEATELQELVARAEWACKKSLNCTKYGFWLHIGKKLGIEEGCCTMRKPYAPLGDDMKRWAEETLSLLSEM